MDTQGKNTLLRIFIFFVLNFGALALGGLATNTGVSSQWYDEILKAPWTPPGWVFGAAWSTIMICFSFYMAYLWPLVKDKKFLLALYTVQWILNVGWNPTFFYYQNVLGGLILICGLTFLVGYFLFFFKNELKIKSVLILPYFIWLLIATSLNAYIFIYN